jgi:hypothetical protein
MALNDKRDSAGIESKGSGKAWVRACDSSGTPSGNWYTLPIVKESTFTDSTAVVEREDEGGNKYASDGARTVTLEMTVLQRDVNALAIYEDISNGYCQVLKEQSSTTVDGNYEYVLLGICKLERNKVIKMPGGEPALKFIGQLNTASLTVGLASISDAAVAGASLGSKTVSANGYYNYFAVAA